MKTLAVVCVALAAPLCLGAGGEDIADWTTMAPVTVSDYSKPLAEFAITQDVFDAARPDLSDLRIIDDTGAEAAYAVRAAGGSKSLVPLAGKLFNEAHAPGNETSVMVDFGSNVMKNRIEVTTSGENFWRRAMVEASDDAKQWYMVVDGALLVRKAGDASAATYDKKRIAFLDNNRRFMRVTVYNASEDAEDVTILDIKCWQYIATPPETLPVEIASTTLAEDEKAKRTDITLDLAWRNLPLYSVELDFENANFLRRVSLSGRNSETEVMRRRVEDAPAIEETVKTPWREMTRDVIYRYTGGGKVDESLAFSPVEGRYRYLKAEVYNASDAPLVFKRATVRMLAYYAAFEPREGRTYTLYFGNERARTPSYDLVNYVNRLRGDGVSVAQVGTAAPNGVKKAARELSWSERNKWVIYVALAAVLIVLAVLVKRQINELAATQKPAEPPEDK